MFGVSQHNLARMYGGPETIPSNGIFSESTGIEPNLTPLFPRVVPFIIFTILFVVDTDRLIIQCFMNLVVLTVIFLLWANNPIQEKVHKS